VIGKVDDRHRALVDLQVQQTPHSPGASVTAWIDTAFDGHLVFPAPLIEALKLESLAETEAILADGSKVTLETFVCYLEWFGKLILLQVVANVGKLPLLGTGLLEDHVLRIDYVNKALTID
jgi:clan AA aspartic protease